MLMSFILRSFYLVVRLSGIGYLFRVFFARNNVTIVLYHRPNPEVFEKHLSYFCRRYNFISMPELISAIYNEDWKTIPQYPLIITFDDGWKENYDLLEIIRKFNVRPTIFLTSHLIDTCRNFWTTICTTEEKKHLKSIKNTQMLSELYDRFKYCPCQEYPNNRQVLNLTEISEMKDFVDFGLHSCFHTILPKCSEQEKRKEILECKDKVEELVGTHSEAFSYPNGEYDDESIKILKEYGIKIARTTEFGWNSKKTDPFKLKAVAVSDNSNVNKLVTEITGVSIFIQKLFRIDG
jgi:peptidoglycan/xylan/chitin deacetylase (PgdA/CDA1 family)